MRVCVCVCVRVWKRCVWKSVCVYVCVCAEIIYFNDDVFLGAPTLPEDFVMPSGAQKVCVCAYRRNSSTSTMTCSLARRHCRRISSCPQGHRRCVCVWQLVCVCACVRMCRHQIVCAYVGMCTQMCSTDLRYTYGTCVCGVCVCVYVHTLSQYPSPIHVSAHPSLHLGTSHDW